MSDSRLNEMIATSLDKIREIAGSDTVMGTPLSTNNDTVIIPVSKISMGFASGGVDYLPKNTSDKSAPAPANNVKPVPGAKTYFGGGGGTGISITPLCFLVVDKNGAVTLLNLADNTPVSPIVGIVDSVGGFLEKSPDLIERLKQVFAKKKDDPLDPLDDEEIKGEEQGK